MSKLYNNSGILGCKSPQKSGNSPQTVGKMVLPAQECENLENPTCSTQLATPFAAPAQGAAGGKFGNGVELGVTERRYVAGDETGSILSGRSTKTQQTGINTHKCFVQKINNNTNTACRTAKKHSKVLRAVACGCLAILMSGTAFLGTACSGNAASMNAGKGSAAGNLIFDDTSEPVFTTKSGVEIRYANAPATSIDTANGCYYFNLGTCNGTAIRWLMLAIGTANPPTDPAGSAISSQIDKQTFATLGKDETTEWGHVVCVSTDILATETINASWYVPEKTHYWNNSTHHSMTRSNFTLVGVTGVSLGVMGEVSVHTYDSYMNETFYAGSQNLTGQTIVGFSSPQTTSAPYIAYLHSEKSVYTYYHYNGGVIVSNLINSSGNYFESSPLGVGHFEVCNSTSSIFPTAYGGAISGSGTLTCGTKAQLIMDLDL